MSKNPAESKPASEHWFVRFVSASTSVRLCLFLVSTCFGPARLCVSARLGTQVLEKTIWKSLGEEAGIPRKSCQ